MIDLQNQIDKTHQLDKLFGQLDRKATITVSSLDGRVMVRVRTRYPGSCLFRNGG